MISRRNTSLAYASSVLGFLPGKALHVHNLKSSRRNALALVAFAYAASMIGFLPGISLYGHELKQRLQLTQTDLLQIAGVQNLTGIFGAVMGVVAQQLGVRGSIICGGLLAAAAQTAQYALALHLFNIPAFAPFVILQVLARCGLMVADASAFAIPVALFQKQRAMVSAIMTCFISGSVALSAQVSQLLEEGAGVPLGGLLFWPFWSLAVSLCAAMVLPENLLSEKEGHDASCEASEQLLNIKSSQNDISLEGEGRADIVNFMFLVLAVFGSFSVLRSIGTILPGVASLHLTFQYGIIASFLFPIFFFCFQNVFGCIRGCLAHLSRASQTVEAPRQLSCLEMLRTVDAWLWLITVAFVYSGSQVFTSNAGEITRSAGAAGDFHKVVATVWSSGVTFGSLLSPILSDVLVSKGLPRTMLPFLSSFLAGGGHTLLASAAHLAAKGPLLLSGAFSIGMAMGTMTVQTGVVVCELFGKSHLVVNNAFYSGICHGPIPYVFMLLAGAMFDRHSASQGQECVGPECFAVMHSIMIVGNLAGAISALILSARTAKIYGGVACCSTASLPKIAGG